MLLTLVVMQLCLLPGPGLLNGQSIADLDCKVRQIVLGQSRWNDVADGMDVVRAGDHFIDPAVNRIANGHSADLIAETRGMQHDRTRAAHTDEVDCHSTMDG